MKFNSVLFDLDGTLADSAPGIFNSIRYALAKCGLPVPEPAVLNCFIGPPLIVSFQRHCGLSKSVAEQVLAAYREYYTVKGIFENSVYSGIPELLRDLNAAHVKCLVATAKPEPFARRILEHFGLAALFAEIHGATFDERRIQKADVIAWALEHSGELGRCVMVGDRANDIEGAHANGLPAIGVLYGYGDEDELRRSGAEMLAATPQDVAGLVGVQARTPAQWEMSVQEQG